MRKRRSETPSESSTMPASTPSSTNTNMLLLIVQQFTTRILTFILQQSLIRTAGSALVGLSSVQLDLLLNTLSTLSRDAVRLVALRGGTALDKVHGRDQQQIITNLAWLTVPLGLLCAIPLLSVYAIYPKTDPVAYLFTLQLYGASMLVEWIFVEPFYIHMMHQYRIRVFADTVAMFVRMGVTWFGIVWPVWYANEGVSEKSALTVFGWAQFLQSLSLALIYAWYRTESWQFYLPRFVAGTFLPGNTMVLWWRQWRQSLVKHLVGSSDFVWLVLGQSSLDDQGVYAVVSHYGSLLARMVFFPVEETTRTLWSDALKGNKEQNAWQHVIWMTALYLRASLLLVFFAPPYSGLLLRILLGLKWAQSAHQALALYCCYLPFMALNGLFEACGHALATPSQVDGASLVMILAVAVYVLVMVLLQWSALFDASSMLVIANMISTSVRLLWSLYVVHSHGNQVWRKSQRWLLPDRWVLYWSFIFACLAWYFRPDYGVVELISKPVLIHLALGVFGGFLWLGLSWQRDRLSLLSIKSA